ncbi:MAG: hypothetical protein R6U01_14175 [Halorubrum sp.]|uniref:DUF7093 family protein n=1 Tax=Halorubrum sp. TaxID=1879286 RepID=UPI003970615D
MGLRCLLGHDFGEPELRREREEDGNEVVTTVTEVKTCARCGETQVVSENTEVTTMEQLADEAAAGAGPTAPTDQSVGGGPAATDEVGPDDVPVGPASTDAGVADADPPVDGDVDDAVIIDDGAGGVETGAENGATAANDGVADPGVDEGATAAADEDAEGGPVGETDDGVELLESGPDDEAGSLGGSDEYAEYPEVEHVESPVDEEQRAETDDGVILDEEDEPTTDRERGAWPEVDEPEDAPTATTPWPEQHGQDEGFSAEVGDGDAGDAVEFGAGLTPEAADTASNDADAEYVEGPARDRDGVGGGAEQRDGEAESIDAGTGITRPESPDLETSMSETATEYHCPECGMTRESDGNSMRAGDICPECKRGYVTERPI